MCICQKIPACDMFCVDFIEKNLLSGQTPLTKQKGGLSNIAGLIVEPMQCSAGYIMPPDDFLKGLKKLSDNYEFLLIVDEVQTGIGRTGKLWAVEYSGIEPDILLVGKGIGGGLPLSAIVARKEVLNNWGPVAHVSTFAGYTLGCAVGLKIFEIIEKDNLLEECNKTGTYFYDGLMYLQNKYSIIGDVTGGRGVFLSIELVKDRKTKEPAFEETRFLKEKCFEYGLLVKASGYFHNRISFIPAITIRKDTVKNAL